MNSSSQNTTPIYTFTLPSASSTLPPASSTPPPSSFTQPPIYTSTQPPASSTPPSSSTQPPASSTQPPASSTQPPPPEGPYRIDPQPGKFCPDVYDPVSCNGTFYDNECIAEANGWKNCSSSLYM